MGTLGPPEALPVRTTRGLGKGGALTLPWVTTLTDPFQMMYHEVPLSPWLNTERSTGQTHSSTHHLSGAPNHVQVPGAQLPANCLTYIQFPPCCGVQRAELLLIPASPVGRERGVSGQVQGRGPG